MVSMIILGITGSMASGKSSLTHRIKTILRLPVWDADQEVQNLYGMKLVQEKILKAFPLARENGRLSRGLLRQIIAGNANNLGVLEAVLYPELAKSREKFLNFHQRQRSPVVILDIPLLFEKNLDGLCDVIILVKSPDWLIQHRILKRPGMTNRLMESLLSKQLPQKEKLRRADFVVDSGAGHHHTWSQFIEIMGHLGL